MPQKFSLLTTSPLLPTSPDFALTPLPKLGSNARARERLEREESLGAAGVGVEPQQRA